MENKKAIVPFKEWVWYLIGAVLAAWGVAQIICGLVLEFAPTTVSEWPLYAANAKYTELFGLSLLHWGLILLALGTITAVICLCITASTYDREAEKQSRRAARLNRVAATEETVVEATVKEEKPEAETK